MKLFGIIVGLFGIAFCRTGYYDDFNRSNLYPLGPSPYIPPAVSPLGRAYDPLLNPYAAAARARAGALPFGPRA